MNIIAPKIEKYTENYSSNESKLLTELRKETYQKTIQPYMISGVYQGRLLSMISKIIQPKSILEVGTFTGYATLCLAEGLRQNGKIITIDKNEELEFLSRKYFKRSEFQNHIHYRFGNALDLIPRLQEDFDLVFLDADKKNYINYYQLIIEKMNKGGVILADNVLWYGKVLEPTDEDDLETATLQEFNRLIKEDNRVEVVLLPIRDGLSLIRKK